MALSVDGSHCDGGSNGSGGSGAKVNGASLVRKFTVLFKSINRFNFLSMFFTLTLPSPAQTFLQLAS